MGEREQIKKAAERKIEIKAFTQMKGQQERKNTERVGERRRERDTRQ